MTLLVTIRIVLLMLGVLLFAYSMRTGTDWARFAAIGLLAAAFLLRFVARFLRSR